MYENSTTHLCLGYLIDIDPDTVVCYPLKWSIFYKHFKNGTL